MITAGTSRYYGVYYRDPSLAFCPSPEGTAGTSATGLQIVWSR
jgi:hypothetical protein